MYQICFSAKWKRLKCQGHGVGTNTCNVLYDIVLYWYDIAWYCTILIWFDICDVSHKNVP